MEETTIKSRLRIFVGHLGIDNRQFQRSIGACDGYMNRESEPTGTIISSVLRAYPQISPDWLLNGDGPMLRSLREHPSVINTATVPDDSSPAENDAPTYVAEPTPAYHGIRSKDITLPVRVYEELLHQLKVKDQQLENAAAQIHTLFEMIKTN